MPSRFQQRVIDEFVDWTWAQGSVPADEARGLWRERIEILLQGRADYLDKPDPTRWRSGDIHELFMIYVAPRQVDAWGLAEHGVETMRDYLRFLDASDRLHPTSTRVSTLLKELDRLESKYRAAMADTSRWRLAKRVFSAVLRDGIALDAGPAVLDGWAARLSARDGEGRREVLGDLMDQHPEYATGRILIHDGRVGVLRAGVPARKHLVWPDLACDCGCEQPVRFPPVALPELGVLAKTVAGEGAGLLRHLADLAAWVGPHGRTVDDRGELRKSDRSDVIAALGLPIDTELRTEPLALTRLWRLAIAFDIVQLRRSRAVSGGGANLVSAVLAGDASPEQTLDLWCELADALIHPPAPPSTRKDLEHLRDWLEPWTPRFLRILYSANSAGGPADLDAMTEQLLVEYAHRLPPKDPELFAGLAAVNVRQALADLAQHGAVTIAGITTEPDPREAAAAMLGTTVWALHPEPGITVDLTDLGRYLVRRRLLAESADAPMTH